ncbi:MAG TPA: methyltransferase domain-containing protein [Sedimenticola sp.]|nr:methyltransferase domain-containing protein [Sedimenticola sp.]
MNDSRKALLEAGILPYGSKELQLYEERLTRYFTREYRRLAEQAPPLEEAGIPTDQGPMWAQTEQLMDEHFDAPTELFRAFLDPEFMAYTMAWYGETPDAVKASTRTLEQAERAKFEQVARRAGIQGNERVFNIGCGFGPLETYLFDAFPELDITSITPSKVQTGYIRECMANPEHPLYRRQLRLIEGDFSAEPMESLGEGEYDVVFAVGAFEHINNLHAALERIHALLKPGGRLFLHLIVSKPVFPQYHDSGVTLIGKFFPGGHIWPFELIGRQTSFFDLEQSWYLNGFNYWRTLEEWHRRFWEHMDELYGPVLSQEAVRHWNDYFIQCKVVLFAPGGGEVYGNGQYLFRRKP